MSHARSKVVPLSSAVVVVCLALAGEATAVSYRVVPVADELYYAPFARSVNNAGQVAGTATSLFCYDYAPTCTDAFVWRPGTMQQPLPPLEDGFSCACEGWGINDAGVVAGRCCGRAVTWSPGGAVTALPPMEEGAAHPDMRALAIGDGGRVVGSGWMKTAPNPTKAFSWDPVGGLVIIGSPDPWESAAAHAVNADGVVAGTAWSASGGAAFTWSAAGGFTVIGDDCDAADINAQGVVVGACGANPGAFVWDAGGGLRPIPGVPGGVEYSIATAVNAAGVVVGECVPSEGEQSAFVWSAAEGSRTLDSLLVAADADWHLLRADDVNDAGQIVARGARPGEAARSVLLEPVAGDAAPAGRAAR